LENEHQMNADVLRRIVLCDSGNVLVLSRVCREYAAALETTTSCKIEFNYCDDSDKLGFIIIKFSLRHAGVSSRSVQYQIHGFGGYETVDEDDQLNRSTKKQPTYPVVWSGRQRLGGSRAMEQIDKIRTRICGRWNSREAKVYHAYRFRGYICFSAAIERLDWRMSVFRLF
jgi:hypothetical protein